MKILLISEKNNLLEEVSKAYAVHIANKYMEFFTPKDMDLETHYDVVIAEECYLNIITIKSVPVIVIRNETHTTSTTDKSSNFIFINSPLDWDKLYDTILSLQYVHSNIDFSNYYKPTVNDLTDNNKTQGETTDKSDKLSNELSTKLYTKEDMKKITTLIRSFGEEQHLDEKTIAQASIILDELIFAIEKFHDANLSVKEPKLIMKLENKDNHFNLFLECRAQLPNFKQVLSVARDYGNMVKSFQRNNSYFLNVQWEKE